MQFPTPAFHSIFRGLKLKDAFLGLLLFIITLSTVFTVDWHKTENFHASAIQTEQVKKLQERVEQLEQKLHDVTKTNSTAPF